MTIDECKTLIEARMRGDYSEGFLPGWDDERDYPPQTDNPTPTPSPDKPMPISLIEFPKRVSICNRIHVATDKEKVDLLNKMLMALESTDT